MQNFEEEIKGIIAEVLEKDPSEITPTARFFEDLGVDSMMALEIMAAIEKRYKITIPEEKLAEMRTLNDTVMVSKQYLEGKQINA
ncbi:MAG: acyl carrier protein [Candidatus Omnitrophica bacterium]|nr:acyl carrier protein [Candidatus Omnitrophota bacterium]